MKSRLKDRPPSLFQLSLKSLTLGIASALGRRSALRHKVDYHGKRRSSVAEGRLGFPELPERKQVERKWCGSSSDKFLSRCGKSVKRKFESDDSSQDRQRKRFCADDISIINTTKKDGECEKYCFRDDSDVNNSTLTDASVIIKLYLSPLHNNLWTVLCSSVLKYIMSVSSVVRERSVTSESELVEKAFEVLLCHKLQKFSASWLTPHFKNIVKKSRMYEKLKHCRFLKSLSVSHCFYDEPIEDHICTVLQSMHQLHTLILTTDITASRVSFHSAFPPVSKHCRKLRELSILYSSDCMDPSEGISCLKSCGCLASLTLYNYGRRSEGKELKNILCQLKSLTYVYHKELLTAILILSDEWKDNDCQLPTPAKRPSLNLERIDMIKKDTGIGSQLIYLCDSFVAQLITFCPKVLCLSLVAPSDVALTDILMLPKLHKLYIQQVSFPLSLLQPVQEGRLCNIAYLSLNDVEDLTYSDISALACGCGKLKGLEIIQCNIINSGLLLYPTGRPPFPRVEEMVIRMDRICQGYEDPPLWQVGRRLVAFVLHKSVSLRLLHLEFCVNMLDPDDIFLEDTLPNLIGSCGESLETVILRWPPFPGEVLVRSLIEKCSSLHTLGNLCCWELPFSFTLPKELSLILHLKFNCML